MDISRKVLNITEIDKRVVELYKKIDVDVQNRLNENELRMRAAKEVAAIKDEIKRMDTKSNKLHDRLKKEGKDGKDGKGGKGGKPKK